MLVVANVLVGQAVRRVVVPLFRPLPPVRPSDFRYFLTPYLAQLTIEPRTIFGTWSAGRCRLTKPVRFRPGKVVLVCLRVTRPLLSSP